MIKNKNTPIINVSKKEILKHLKAEVRDAKRNMKGYKKTDDFAEAAHNESVADTYTEILTQIERCSFDLA